MVEIIYTPRYKATASQIEHTRYSAVDGSVSHLSHSYQSITFAFFGYILQGNGVGRVMNDKAGRSKQGIWRKLEKTGCIRTIWLLSFSVSLRLCPFSVSLSLSGSLPILMTWGLDARFARSEAAVAGQ